jgi:glycosyltransferase involved in cell wall biosynthesis
VEGGHSEIAYVTRIQVSKLVEGPSVIKILRDGETGILADASDPEALGAPIIGLLTSPERLERMGEKAAARPRDHYSSTVDIVLIHRGS